MARSCMDSSKRYYLKRRTSSGASRLGLGERVPRPSGVTALGVLPREPHPRTKYLCATRVTQEGCAMPSSVPRSICNRTAAFACDIRRAPELARRGGCSGGF